MSSKIRVLPDDVINKIAAGEVIENPASVVKELVENSLDAHATAITVEITSGGRQLIRISDNGCGMGPDDALLCLERHGTSKIRNIDDLFELSTMGFRGEAVPSIASISKFTLITSPAPEEGSATVPGTMVLVEGGKILQCTPVVRDPGTTIEVKGLFYNVPVRKKFQKSPAYDSSEILKTLSLLALANPFVSFRFISDHKVLLATPQTTQSDFETTFKERVCALLGSDLTEESIWIHKEEGEYCLKGLIGLPSYTRQNRTGQHLFLNQRPVWSPLISHAVREGYGTSLPSARYPVYALHLTMPGDLVDVNVHPQKREVRIRKEQELRQIITSTICAAMQNRPMESGHAFHFSSLDLSTASIEVPPPPAFSIERPTTQPEIQQQEPPPFWSTSKTFFQPKTSPQPPVAPQQTEIFTKKLPSSMKLVATVRGYLLAEKDGLYLIDQRRAHQRVIFERLTRHAKGEKGSEVQTLLIPHSIEVSNAEAASIRTHLEMFQHLGFSIREFGRQQFLVDAVPECLAGTDVKALILNILTDLEQFQQTEKVQQEQEKRMALVACRSALSSDVRLSLEEGQSLLDQLTSCQTPTQCPQGKKTLTPLHPEDLSKHFL